MTEYLNAVCTGALGIARISISISLDAALELLTEEKSPIFAGGGFARERGGTIVDVNSLEPEVKVSGV